MTIDSQYQAGFMATQNRVRSGEPVGGSLKRGLDICIAVAGLVLVFPLMLFLACLIWSTTGRSPVFRHKRLGRGGVEFECLKFRTMVANADQVLAALLASDPAAAEDWRRNQKLARDPRITLLGHILRRSSLDELPQLINVLRGEMSCVGPRPIVRDELARYGGNSDVVLQVRPGMTGLWQVSGRNSIGYDRRVSLDCEYVRNWSLWLDLKILFRTIPAMLKTRQTS